MERNKAIVRVGLMGIIVNCLLVVLKAAVGFLTHSIAITMDALSNLSDVLSSLITIIGTRLSALPPSRRHPYGYGKIEHLSSLTIATIILVTGITSFIESVKKILEPAEAEYTVTILLLVAAAVVVRFILGNYQKRRGKSLSSEALIAVGTDTFLDSVISLAALLAALINMCLDVNIEGLLSAVISILIAKSGVELILESAGDIIGRRVDPSLTDAMKADIRTVPGVRGAYDLILHRYGTDRTIGSVHVEVDDNTTAKQIHEISQDIFQLIHEKYGAILTVGIYAANLTDPAVMAKQDRLAEVLKSHPEVMSFHGFYTDDEKKLMRFDLVMNYKVPNPPEVRDRVIRDMQAVYPNYDFSVSLDQNFSE